MQFNSYAKNCVDVVLWRAFKNIPSGFYLDLNPDSPGSLSVTKALYDHGWRGINVLHRDDALKQFRAQRPKDINLLAHPEQALGELWHGHIESRQTVHLIRVRRDCVSTLLSIEGWPVNRPWLVMVETEPGQAPDSSDDVPQQWLLTKNYQLAYSDGIHQLYLAQEQSQLLDALKHPPHIFDDFKPAVDPKLLIDANGSSQQSGSYFRLLSATQEFALRERALAKKLNAELTQALAQAETLKTELQTVYGSKSWRITHPLRVMVTAVSIQLPNSLRRILARNLAVAAQHLDSRPALAQFIRRTLNRAPAVKQLLLRFAGISSSQNTGAQAEHALSVGALADMPPRAQQIYADLRAEIDKNKKD